MVTPDELRKLCAPRMDKIEAVLDLFHMADLETIMIEKAKLGYTSIFLRKEYFCQFIYQWDNVAKSRREVKEFSNLISPEIKILWEKLDEKINIICKDFKVSKDGYLEYEISWA